jgi:hypothetical protein
LYHWNSKKLEFVLRDELLRFREESQERCSHEKALLKGGFLYFPCLLLEVFLLERDFFERFLEKGFVDWRGSGLVYPKAKCIKKLLQQ